ISDAGTPGITDPGFLLVRESLKAGISVECLPGPTAFVPPLVISGLPCDRFHFEGFLPPKKGRQTRLKELALLEPTIVLYESPHKISKTLDQLCEYLGPDRQASVSRELTKMYEETIRGTLAEIGAHFKATEPRGEMVVVVGGLSSVAKSKE
ncbi:MAG: rRNA small subunit methyltransferase 1, partial [Bacteroidia bacterium]|nr:rRNA small subunit methyltransferase 1 [Bacteroidia bacterium]